jgi:hypothetical protein
MRLERIPTGEEQNYPVFRSKLRYWIASEM